ncbi:MAG: ferredoxin [Chloroflexi bacterium]|nr:ferredoxin [Chloroflexota bacterium]
MAGFKVTIDRDECISCGACWADCPDFFEEGDDGLCQVLEQYRTDDNVGEGVAPAELEDCVRSAAEGCPVEAIHVE